MPKDINGNEIPPLSGFLNPDGTPIEGTSTPTPTQGTNSIPDSIGTELKPTETPKPTELTLPEQKQTIYTDNGGQIDMNSVDYQNYLTDKAKRKSEAGTSAQEGNLTPEQIQAEKTTVTTPQGTTTTVKETPKPTVDKTARNNEIVANLNEGYKNDPTVQQAINSGNFEQFKAKYNMNDPEEARIVEAYFQAHQPKDSETIYNLLRNGQTISKNVANTPEYEKAKLKLGLINKYSNASADILYSAMINGEIPSEIENELKTNPNYAIAKEKVGKKSYVDSLNGQMKNSYNIMTGGTSEIKNYSEKISDKVSSDLSGKGIDLVTFKDYLSKNNPEIVSQSKELSSKNKQIKELNDEIEKTLKSVISRYPGLPKGSAIALATKENEALYERLRTLEYDATELSSNIKFQTGLAEKDYDAQIKKQETQEQRAYEKSTLQEQRTYDQKVADDKLKKEFDYTYGDLTSTDPRIQKVAGERIATAIQKQYEGMPFRRDISTMGADIVNEIKSGKSIDQITTEITDNIQNAPAYNQWAMSKGLVAAPKEVKYDFTTFDNKLVRTDSNGNAEIIATGTPKASEIKGWEKVGDFYQSPTDGSLWSKEDIDKAKIADNSYLNAPVGTNVGVECGQFARTATGLTATPGGNSLTERKAQFSEQNPAVGGLVLFSGGGYDKTYGHIAVVTGVNADGTINVKESNYRGDKKVTERKNVPLTYVSGFYNNTPLAGGGKKSELSTEQQRITANQEKSAFRSNPEVKAFESAMSANRNLIISLQKGSAPGDVAGVYQFMKSLDPNSVVRESEFAIAASASGLGDRAKSVYDKVINGEKLTEQQRKEFGTLAKEYIKAMGQTYDRLYGDMERTFNYFGLPKEILPTKATLELNKSTTPAPTKTTGEKAYTKYF